VPARENRLPLSKPLVFVRVARCSAIDRTQSKFPRGVRVAGGNGHVEPYFGSKHMFLTSNERALSSNTPGRGLA
jgi:hypothetical protein